MWLVRLRILFLVANEKSLKPILDSDKIFWLRPLLSLENNMSSVEPIVSKITVFGYAYRARIPEVRQRGMISAAERICAIKKSWEANKRRAEASCEALQAISNEVIDLDVVTAPTIVSAVFWIVLDKNQL